MNDSFVDTNIPLGYTFLINSKHEKSLKVKNEYKNLFWSYFVKKEFERRYDKKKENLIRFYNDLKIYFANPGNEFYSESSLGKYASRNYSGKTLKDVKNSISCFWKTYINNESYINYSSMYSAIFKCSEDLNYNLIHRKLKIMNLITLTPKRTKKYSSLNKELDKLGVSPQDINVILDAHDFSLNRTDAIDFITFDDKCYEGASMIKELEFNKVKSRFDY